jgi:hypothetical protein
MGLWLGLLATLPLIYNFYNTSSHYQTVLPMQASLIQTAGFTLYTFSAFCMASMLPCGRYYYDPEGGYVGNPWVKFSYQYAYLYMAWFIHHLDSADHYGYQLSQGLTRRCSGFHQNNFGLPGVHGGSSTPSDTASGFKDPSET